MKTLILTEGGSNCGFGHLTRCGALYDAFDEKKIDAEMIVNTNEDISKTSGGKNYKTLDWLESRRRLSDIIKGKDIVVIDSYLADIGVYRYISENIEIPVYLDDTKRLDYPRGIVVNGALYGKGMDYPKRKDITYLLGTKFLPLREEFCDLPGKNIAEEVKVLMVTFGGDDLCDMTPKVLKVLVDKYPCLIKKVIVGKGFRNVSEIEKNKDGLTEIVYCPDAGGMKEIMLKSDIAISAGGQTLYELARVGVPTVTIPVAENQLNNSRYLQKNGFIGYPGLLENEDTLFDKLPAYVDRLMSYKERAKRSEAVRQCVVGNGAENIVDAILEKASTVACAEKKEVDIALRSADQNDCYDIWSWRESSEVRKWSFNKKKIDYCDHEKWFMTKLRDINTAIYIVENERRGKLGQIRFEKYENGIACVSVNLNPIYLGQGLGSRVIKEGMKFFVEKEKRVNEIVAEVMSKNVASEKAFLKAGYVRSSKATKVGRVSLVFNVKGK